MKKFETIRKSIAKAIVALKARGTTRNTTLLRLPLQTKASLSTEATLQHRSIWTSWATVMHRLLTSHREVIQ